MLQHTFLNNLELDAMKLICSLNTQIDLSLDKLPKEKWNLWTIEAIGCVKPQSEKVHLALTTPYRKIREIEAAVLALGKIKPQSEKVQLKLLSLVLKSGSRVSLGIVDTLSRIKPQSEKVHLELVNILVNGNADARLKASYILSKIRSQSQNFKKD